jgi:hypothetical protein
MEQEKKKPTTIRDKELKANIWENENERGTYHSVTFAKTITGDDGKPRDVQSFSHNDLLRIAELGRETYGKINDMKRDAFKERRANEAAHEREQFKQR